MKKLLIVVAVLLILLLGGALVYAFMHRTTPTEEPGGTNFPQSGGLNTAGTSVVLQTIAGQEIRVKDFKNNGETIVDPQNPGNYLLAGELGYCLPDMKCTAATSTEFNIGYSEKENAFTIALLTEPLGQARRDAEQFLLTRLGLTEIEMCALNYYVGTTYWISERYATGNLGFSFCPGATQLP